MRKLFITSFILLTSTNALALSTCPAAPVKLSCEQGIWRTQTNPLPDSFEVTDNEIDGKPCDSDNAKLVFEKGFEAYQGWGVECFYTISGADERILAVSSRTYQHDGGKWSFDYNWRWRCFGPNVKDCPVIPF